MLALAVFVLSLFLYLLFCSCCSSLVQGVALQNIALAIAVVFFSIAVLSGFAVAALVASLVLGTTLGTVGMVKGGVCAIVLKRRLCC